MKKNTNIAGYNVSLRTLGRSCTQNRDDWYPDCRPMVHLRCRQGLAAHAPSTPTRDARVFEEEAGCRTEILNPNEVLVDLKLLGIKYMSSSSMCSDILEQGCQSKNCKSVPDDVYKTIRLLSGANLLSGGALG